MMQELCGSRRMFQATEIMVMTARLLPMLEARFRAGHRARLRRVEHCAGEPGDTTSH